MMSFTITSAVGSRNQMRPSNRRETKKEEGMKTTCGAALNEIYETQKTSQSL
jgi:hypothetical protein